MRWWFSQFFAALLKNQSQRFSLLILTYTYLFGKFFKKSSWDPIKLRFWHWKMNSGCRLWSCKVVLKAPVNLAHFPSIQWWDDSGKHQPITEKIILRRVSEIIFYNLEVIRKSNLKVLLYRVICDLVNHRRIVNVNGLLNVFAVISSCLLIASCLCLLCCLSSFKSSCPRWNSTEVLFIKLTR
jgi:hypothetical protein